ncbi:polysaccharide deacetylase family protein [Butyrivibrio sp. YAB3001]|uniref:polysaccharide deacetylase family protein n=1 Tax=Butyrivibrio sp. YAB3001 TaxID=1520812 RepID=UPI0008F638D4|nr:polysaccharide deacetylase family protein [Butyrivibrio sp. YAB3001]SFC93066.1 Polysaccharide deacetylase [Butyrivibrio sp. YAB3001]
MTSYKDSGKPKKEYSRRIKNLRRLIVTVVLASCFIPTCICVILAVRYDRLRTRYDQNVADLQWYRDNYGTEMEILSDKNKTDQVLTEETGQDKSDLAADSNKSIVDTKSLIDSEVDASEANLEISGAQNPEDIEGTRYVYLTFDDGPSSSTDQILDILARYNVKATFFVCGKPDAKYTDKYKRIVDEGHTLGMHSYSHKYNEIYESVDSFKADLDKLRIFLYETTGQWSKFYRFPGGSSNKVSTVSIRELIECLDDAEITFFDWNVSAGDTASDATSSSIYNNIVSNIPRFKHCVVLMHDSADKKATVTALPDIIEAIQGMEDTVIVPITNDTLPVQHIKY